MFTERTSLGLDVHARSVLAAAIDTSTGAAHIRLTARRQTRYLPVTTRERRSGAHSGQKGPRFTLPT